MLNKVRIGTRGSKLALWQAERIKSLLKAEFPKTIIEIETIRTTGDRILDSPLSKIGSKGIFTKELESALLCEKIDLAVHSYKDVPTSIAEGLTIGAVLRREDAHDVFISNPKKLYGSINELPQQAMIATGSLRRASQLLNQRSDIRIVDIRGNLDTRLKKLDDSDWDGMILAKAGVTRLGYEKRIIEIVPFKIMLPAAGQGALAVETRAGDKNIEDMLRTIHHTDTDIAVTAERALLKRLEGGCQIPVGAYAEVHKDELLLDAVIGSLDGRKVIRGKKSGRISEAERIGSDLAAELLERGGREILAEIRDQA